MPFIYFRQHHTNTELNLRSSNRRSDALLILIVLVIESAFELMAFDTTISQPTPHQVLLGASLTFLIIFIGTVLPTMVLIAAMHIVEGWSTFDSPRNTVLSLIIVFYNTSDLE
jgi:predicted neutral ceramidase superfamily lipid hydrolase